MGVKQNMLADEPDTQPLDAPAASRAVITFQVPCPDCDWCTGLAAVLTLDAEELAVVYDPELTLAVERVLVVGRDLEQVGFAGLSDKTGKVCVGPCHPAYVAVNLAYQAGFTAVDISGAAPGLQERLRPFLDPVADKIAVTFT